LDLVSVLVLGFPGDADQLPMELKERELRHSARRPLGELVHHGRFNG
jgi:hypothetical protein